MDVSGIQTSVKTVIYTLIPSSHCMIPKDCISEMETSAGGHFVYWTCSSILTLENLTESWTCPIRLCSRCESLQGPLSIQHPFYRGIYLYNRITITQHRELDIVLLNKPQIYLGIMVALFRMASQIAFCQHLIEACLKKLDTSETLNIICKPGMRGWGSALKICPLPRQDMVSFELTNIGKVDLI